MFGGNRHDDRNNNHDRDDFENQRFIPLGRDRPFNEIRLADTSIRPQYLEDIIGQESVKRTLGVYVKSANRRRVALDHVLLYGPPGLGKTTIASVIAAETRGDLIAYTGPRLDVETLVGQVIPKILHTADTYDESGHPKRIVLFIDELHGLIKEVQTLLLPLLEDFQFEDIHIPAFTVIGATTDPSKVVAPLRDRFGITYSLDYYPDSDILKILTRSLGVFTETSDWKIAEKLADILIDEGDPLGLDEALATHDLGRAWSGDYPLPRPTPRIVETSDTNLALQSLASRSLGVPRTANHLLLRTLDFAYSYMGDEELEVNLDVETVRDAMQALEIDRDGLGRTERAVLKIMLERYGDRAVGIRAIAAALGESYTNIEDVIEPALVRKGYLNREARGRKLSTAGMVKAALEIDGQTQWV